MELVNKPKETETEKPAGILELVITYDPARDILNVSGPIANKILAYGMLQRACDAIKDYQVAEGRIIPVSHFPGLRSQ